MELLIIRHALPKRVVNADPSIPADPPLDDRGWEQAERLGGYLAEERIDAIWCSPLTRAQQTAQPLAQKTGIAIQTESGLSEWDRDSPEYIPVEELKATNHPMWQAMLKGEWTGAADPETFLRNVIGSFERIIDEHRGQKVAAVCHGGVINAYLSHILSMERSFGFFRPEYTSIHRVMAASSGERTLMTLNETAHLRGTGLL